jgi:hypothetical protein
MPNWCENDLTVEGPPEVVEEFVRLVEGAGPFDFDRLVPYPEEYRRLDAIAEAWDRDHADNPARAERKRPRDGFNAGGYDWRVAHWGTKWRAFDVDREEPGPGRFEGTVQVVYHFATAWSPPLPVVRQAAERFPALEFELRYFERGAGFNGLFLCRGGRVSRDERGPYFGDRGG